MGIAPKTISSQWICILTYYDKMSNEERDLVFKAYKYKPKDEIYEIENPQLLTEAIIKKLI